MQMVERQETRYPCVAAHIQDLLRSSMVHLCEARRTVMPTTARTRYRGCHRCMHNLVISGFDAELQQHADQCLVQHLQFLPQQLGAMRQPEGTHSFVACRALHGDAQGLDGHVGPQGIVFGTVGGQALCTAEQRAQFGQGVASRTLNSLLQSGHLNRGLYLEVIHEFELVEADAVERSLGCAGLAGMTQCLGHRIRPRLHPPVCERVSRLRQLLYGTGEISALGRADRP